MKLADHTIAAAWREKGLENSFPKWEILFDAKTDDFVAFLDNMMNGSRRIVVKGGCYQFRSPPYTLTMIHRRAARETSDLKLPEGAIRWLRDKVLMDMEFYEAGDMADWMAEWLPMGYQGILVRLAMLEVL